MLHLTGTGVGGMYPPEVRREEHGRLSTPRANVPRQLVRGRERRNVGDEGGRIRGTKDCVVRSLRGEVITEAGHGAVFTAWGQKVCYRVRVQNATVPHVAPVPLHSVGVSAAER